MLSLLSSTIVQTEQLSTMTSSNDSNDNTDNSPLPDIQDPFYPPPAWAVLPKPQQEWTLIEIKGGVEMERFPLHRRPSWLIGRAADQVHIALGHESISRCHARIAFDATGVPWLRDCNSSHGVCVNKKRLPPAARGTVESNSTQPGSRGVTLYPGDVLQFGASTRIYCVEGPAEYQRGSIRIAPAKLKQPVLVKATIPETPQEEKDDRQQQPPEEDAGVSWGISMDEAADHQEEEDDEGVILKRQQALEDGANIPDKHRKAWEKIVALKYKLKNVVTESERIQAKGSGADSSLTTGQEHQLQKNQQRTQELQEKITERERELYEKLYPEESGSQKKKRRRKHHTTEDDDDDVDDFFDRTKDNTATADGGDGETEASLLAKWNSLQSKRRATKVASERARQKIASQQQRLERLQAAGDDEAFFAQNDLDLVSEQSRKLERDQSAIDKELAETQRLLKIVNPKLVLEENSNDTNASSSSSSMAPPAGRKILSAESSTDDTNTNASVVMPPPSFRPSPGEAVTDESAKSSASSLAGAADGNGFMMPPPKRMRSVGPAAPPPLDATGTDSTKRTGSPMPSPAAVSHPS